MSNKLLFFIPLLILFFSACGSDSSQTTLDPVTQQDPITEPTPVTEPASVTITEPGIDPKYFGSWRYVHDASELYIISTTQLDFEEVDINQLKVNDNGLTKYLIRNGVQNVNLSGSILNNTLTVASPARSASLASSFSGIGSLNIILSNVLDETITSTMQTDEYGDFNDNTLPSGTYNLTAIQDTNEVITEVVLSDVENPLGNFYLVQSGENNFKAELIIPSDFIYADGWEYNATLRIHNITDIDGVGLNFDITVSDEKIKSFTKVIDKGTLPANSYKDQLITLSFNPFSLNERKIEIEVNIIDALANQWSDKISFTAYRAKTKIHFLSENANIRGYVTLPNNNQKTIDIDEGYIEVPYLIDGRYYIVLSNPDLTQETAYSIGNDAIADNIAFQDFNITSIYEAINDKQSTAIEIMQNKSISAYLHAGDLDFYTLQISNASPLFSLFIDVNDTNAFTSYTSNDINISQEILAYGSSASVDNGSIIKNGVDVNQSTSIVLGDIISLKLTSLDNNQTNRATLSIGKLTAEFDIPVGVVDDVIDTSNFVSQQASDTYQEWTSSEIIINDINTPITVSTDRGTLVLDGTDTNLTSITAKEGDSIRINLKVSYAENTTTTAVVMFANERRTYSVSTDTAHGYDSLAPTQTTLYRFTLNSGGGNGSVVATPSDNRTVSFYDDIGKTSPRSPNGLTGTYYMEISSGSGDVSVIFFDNQTTVY